MCGRYTLTHAPAELAEVFHLQSVPPDLPPRFNIAPTQNAPVIRYTEATGRRLDLLRWGLVPFWADDPRRGARMINARVETVAGKPAFRNAFRKRRCLVPADGYYEWHSLKGGHKQPWWVGFQDRPLFAFAGLWERWEGQDPPLESYTIITMPAQGPVARLHDRMPVILSPGDYADWLDTGLHDPGRLQSLLNHAVTEGLICYPVSRRVNNPRNDDPALLQPVEAEA